VNWYKRHPQSTLYVGLTLAVPLLLLVYLVLTLWAQRGEYQRELERLEPRIARLSGLVQSEDALRQSSGRVDSRVLDLVFPATEDRAAIAAALQQDVRAILSDAGLDIKNSQVLPAREVSGLDYLTVKLQVTGDLEALDTALEEFSNYTPLMLVESLAVTPVRQSRRQRKSGYEQVVTATLQLLALRAGQAG
jgi:general secretion pathway protein M